MTDPQTYTQERSGRDLGLWRNGIAFYEEASRLGLAPVVVSADDEQLTTQACQPLLDWLAAYPDRTHEMGVLLFARVKELHSHGICHRDLHDGNVLVRADGVPVFIDFDFATHGNPDAPCYDLYGPGPSRLPVPDAHAAQTGSRNANGAYWDNAEHRTLREMFGPVTDFDR